MLTTHEMTTTIMDIGKEHSNVIRRIYELYDMIKELESQGGYAREHRDELDKLYYRRNILDKVFEAIIYHDAYNDTKSETVPPYIVKLYKLDDE